MTQSSVFALTVATAVLQQLQPILEESTQPCLRLSEQISALLTRYLCAPITPASTFAFETDLSRLLDECGRLVVGSVFNHIEPEDAQDAPKHTQRDRQDYSRKNDKSPIRSGIATLFGHIELRRCLYEPLQGVELLLSMKSSGFSLGRGRRGQWGGQWDQGAMEEVGPVNLDPDLAEDSQAEPQDDLSAFETPLHA